MRQGIQSVGIAAAIALRWLLLSHTTLAGDSAVFTDVSLPYRIFSSPAPWQADGGRGLAFALVIGKAEGAETATAVYACLSDGRHLHGFPKFEGEAMMVAPGNQVFGGGAQRAPWVIDVQGHWRPILNGPVLPGHPDMGLLAAPTVALGDGGACPGCYLMTGRDFQPVMKSRNSLALFDSGGNPRPGFPVALATIPEALSPVVDAAGERAWVMLLSGQVDGFRLRDGTRLPGFPTPVPSGNGPPDGNRVTIGPDPGSLYVARGSAVLLRIDAHSGQVTEVTVPGAERLVNVATAGDHLFAFDEGRGRLLQLDGAGRELAGLDLAAPNGSRNVLLWKVALPSDALLLVSLARVDEAARVDQLYAGQAPKDVQLDLAKRMADKAMRRYGTLAPTAAQQLELDHDQAMLKRGWLEKTLGIDKLGGLLTAPPITRVQIVSVSAGGLVKRLDNTIPGYVPHTGFSQSEQVLPALCAATSTTRQLLVPLNAAASASDSAAYHRALVRIYTLPPG